MTPEEKKELEKLFTQKLANYGVMQFNIKALTKDSYSLFAEIVEIKNKLEAEKAPNDQK
jgi:hypothetical protein